MNIKSITRKSVLFIGFATLLINGKAIAQNQAVSNKTEEQQVFHEPCLFDHVYEKKRLDPAFRQMEKEHNLMMAAQMKKSFPKTIYQVPVVVHVLHKGEAIGVGTNISDAQIQSAIDNLNDVYRNTIGNASSIDMGVEFHLAVRDPDCNVTNGIVRVNASAVSGYTQYGVKMDGSVGADEQTLKDLSKWPTDQYMNFWIVSEIDNNNGDCGIQGYANLPMGIDDYNGSVMLAGTFGYDPTGTLGYVFGACGGDNSTVTHEVGHFLDLYHTFEGGGDGSCPGAESNCATENDYVCDTPPHMYYMSSNPTLYFNCTAGHANECAAGTMDEVIHNIMNYTGCPDRFTAGQKTRVTACLTSSRASLTTSMGLTAVTGTFTPPVAACASITTGQGLTGGYAGITEVQFNNLTKVSSSTNIDNPTNGYMDFSTSCINSINVDLNGTYSLKVTTWFNTQKVKAWIDYNNDGDFSDTGEEITTSGGLTSTSGAQVTQSVTIPGTATTNTYLRMRVISDMNSGPSGPCHTSTYGQTEDYAIYINGSVTNVASVSIASSDADNSFCAGTSVTFTATPTNGGTTPSYQWKVDGVNVGTDSPTYTTSSLTNGQVVTCVMTSNLPGVTGSPATSASITNTVTTTSTPTGTASQSFCDPATVADLTATGTAIQWYSASTGGSALATTTALATGNYYATQTISGCESATRLAVAVTVNSASTPTGSASQTFCNNETVADLVATGTAIQWYSTSTGGTALPTTDVLVTGNYYASQTVSGCESASRLAVAVTAGGAATPTGSATQSFCNAGTVADLVATGTAIQWYAAASGGTALATTDALVDATTYYATQTVSGCESPSRLAVTVSINTTPTNAPTGSASQTYCSSATVADLVATGTAIQWYAASSGGSALATSTALVDATTYYASQTVGGCESATRLAVTVTIGGSTSTPTGSATQSFCTASTVADLTATGTAIQWYAASTGGSALATSTSLVNGTTYYATQTVGGCESSSRLAVAVTVGSSSTPTGSASQSFCGSSTVANLSATGTAIQWYAASSGGTALATSTALVNGTTYYATQTVSGCESTSRLAVSVTVTTTGAPTGTASQSFCSASTIANLTATGTAIQWYAASSGGSALATSTSLVNGTTYYATQTVSGCESTSRFAVTVTIGSSATPTGSSSQSFCNSGTVADLVATGTAIQWFSTASGGSALATSTALVNGTTYYASQTVGGCTSTTRLAVSVSVINTAAPTGSASQSLCPTSTVADLVATGTSIQWYTTSTGGTALATTTGLTNGATYYASQTVSGCVSSSRLAVTVTIGTAPSAPSGSASQSFCGSATVADLVATGTSIQWYGTPSGGSPLASTTPLSNGSNYYATQSNGCESTSRLVVAVSINPAPTVTLSSFPTVCNTDAAFSLTQGSPIGGTYSGTGVSSGSFNPTTAGAGTVTITYTYTNVNLCTGTATGTILVNDCVGVPELTQLGYLIYPNPVNGNVTILSNNEMIKSVKLYDNTGRLILIETISDNETEVKLDLGNYADGMYTVQIASESRVINSQIIIKK